MSKREKIIELLEAETHYLSFDKRLHLMDADSREHIISTAESCLETRSGGISGGSFVQAVVDNNLHGAFAKADHINRDFIEFYLKVLYNIV
jgi:hypothetical protein